MTFIIIIIYLCLTYCIAILTLNIYVRYHLDCSHQIWIYWVLLNHYLGNKVIPNLTKFYPVIRIIIIGVIINVTSFVPSNDCKSMIISSMQSSILSCTSICSKTLILLVGWAKINFAKSETAKIINFEKSNFFF